MRTRSCYHANFRQKPIGEPPAPSSCRRSPDDSIISRSQCLAEEHGSFSACVSKHRKIPAIRKVWSDVATSPCVSVDSIKHCRRQSSRRSDLPPPPANRARIGGRTADADRTGETLELFEPARRRRFIGSCIRSGSNARRAVAVVTERIELSAGRARSAFRPAGLLAC
jgi:hypothetical protein